jgi:predicted dehydrogenase
MDDRRKRIGLMGCGVVAGYGHIPALAQTAGLELYALYDPVEANLRKAQAQSGAPHAFLDLEEFFACGLDAVTITSPAPFHLPNVLACARHRLPALCEKPLAMNGIEAEEMIRAMSAAGVSLYTGFCYRFSPSSLKIRELVQGGAIGEVRSLRLIYNWNVGGKFQHNPATGNTLNQRREGRMLEGGPMVDCGTHQIDLALFWLNSPIVRHWAHGAWVDNHVAPDHMWLHLDHANGAHTVVEISYSYGLTTLNKCTEFIYELIGTKGVLRYDREDKTFIMENEDGQQSFPFHHEKDFPGMYAEWSTALRTGRSGLLPSGRDGMLVAEVARSATDAVIRERTAMLEAAATAMSKLSL